MTGTYCLQQAFIDSRKSVPISEAEYLALKHAREVLSQALDFEQRYELLVGNFIAMELAFTEMSLRSAVERTRDYAGLAKVLQEANRHLANILTAAKSYIDQVVQDFKLLQMTPSFQEAAKAWQSQQFDESLEYRFMEALRNHTQHHALPATSFGGDHERHGANDWVEWVHVKASKSELFSNPKFKRKFLDDLPDKVDLRLMSREYVRRIGIVHVELRGLVAEEVRQSRDLIEATIAGYGADGGSTSGLVACSDEDGDGKFSLFTDWDDVRVMLARKNAVPPDLWPRSRGNQTTATEVRAARLSRNQSIEVASELAGVSSMHWARYEAGLRIPPSIYNFYLLQTDQHPTHTLAPRRQDTKPGA